MKLRDIVTHRLFNQQLADPVFSRPHEVVSHMVAMQSQEFAMAKWAIGLRLKGCTEAMVEKEFNEGLILRTHLMRPTWHFVSPADIRWLLQLTAPRVHAVNAFTYRQSGFLQSTFTRSNDTIAKTLEGGKSLTRTELQAALDRAGIKVAGIPLSALVMYAELEGIICSGPRKGKQFTYCLLEERVPPTKKLSREEALLQFTKRYFQTRGPATVRDFATWSGLTMKDVKEASNNLDSTFSRVIVDGQEYFFKETAAPKNKKLQKTILLPDYDEYGMSYKDRTALFVGDQNAELSKGGNAAYEHMIVINGTVGGTWKKVMVDKNADIETGTYAALGTADEKAVAAAVKKYLRFFGKDLTTEKSRRKDK